MHATYPHSPAPSALTSQAQTIIQILYVYAVLDMVSSQAQDCAQVELVSSPQQTQGAGGVADHSIFSFTTANRKPCSQSQTNIEVVGKLSPLARTFTSRSVVDPLDILYACDGLRYSLKVAIAFIALFCWEVVYHVSDHAPPCPDYLRS